MNIKYHSGLMPAGADTNGSALIPSSQGKNTDRNTRIFSTKPQHSIANRKIGKEGHASEDLAFLTQWFADTLKLHEGKMYG